MTKISYEERINLYYDRKNGKSFPSLKSKYGINKSGVEYLVRLIDKHGFDILRTNENKSYSSMEKERILNRILMDNESILSVSIVENGGSVFVLKGSDEIQSIINLVYVVYLGKEIKSLTHTISLNCAVITAASSYHRVNDTILPTFPKIAFLISSSNCEVY